MNQKERMLAGVPYKAWMDGLSEERLENAKRIYRFNMMSPEESIYIRGQVVDSWGQVLFKNLTLL